MEPPPHRRFAPGFCSGVPPPKARSCLAPFSPKTKGATLASNPPRRKVALWSRPATFSRNSGQVTLGYKKHRPDGWQGISGAPQPAVGPAGDVTSRGDE